MKILIADDVKEVRILFKAALSCEFLDSQVDEVADGTDAVDAFRKVYYDVILMDLYMPEKSGYEACVEIQEICRQKNLKLPFVIFCTGYAAPEEVKKLMADKAHYTQAS